MTFKDIQDYVDLHYSSTDRYSVHTYKIDESEDITVGVSLRIYHLLKQEPRAREEILNCLNRFYKADFGTFYEDEDIYYMPTNWQDRNAYGEYMLDCFDIPIYIHYEQNFMYDTVIYLMCER